MSVRAKILTAGALGKILRKVPIHTPIILTDDEGIAEIPVMDVIVAKEEKHNNIEAVVLQGNFSWVGDPEDEEEGDPLGAPYGDIPELPTDARQNVNTAVADVLRKVIECKVEEPDCVNYEQYPFLQQA